jgi:hypothetical protein
MSITNALVGRSVLGDKCLTYGTYTDSGAGTEDNIDTKLHRCEMIILQAYGTSAATDAPAVNETLPVAGSAVTVITKASESGIWIAIGDSFN